MYTESNRITVMDHLHFIFRENIIFFYERRVIYHGENYKEHNRV